MPGICLSLMEWTGVGIAISGYGEHGELARNGVGGLCCQPLCQVGGQGYFSDSTWKRAGENWSFEGKGASRGEQPSPGAMADFSNKLVSLRISALEEGSRSFMISRSSMISGSF
jgi:hypothetical protein